MDGLVSLVMTLTSMPLYQSEVVPVNMSLIISCCEDCTLVRLLSGDAYAVRRVDVARCGRIGQADPHIVAGGGCADLNPLIVCDRIIADFPCLLAFPFVVKSL